MDQKRFQQTLRRAFWIPFGIAVILATTLIIEVHYLMDQAAWVEHTDEVISISQLIYRNRVDQETGLRAYLLTNDKRFLDPFYAGRDQALELEPKLRQLVADNPEQTERNEKAIQASAAWLSWADQAIAMTKAGGNAGDVAFQLRGKALMDHYRLVRQEFAEREQQLRDERIAWTRRSAEIVNTSIVALAILFALGLAFIGRKQLTNLSRSFTGALNTAREQRDWLHTTMTSIGDAVIATDAGGRITLMNPVAEKLTGWTLEEAQDKPLTEVFRIINQKTRQTVENPVDKVRRLNRVVGLANHTILISKSGEDVAIDDSGAPIFGPDGTITGIVLVFRDVTTQRKADAVLHARQTELENIVNRTPFMLTRCSRDLRYQFVSRTYAQFLARQPEQVIGKPIIEIMGEEGFTTIRPHIEKVLAGELVEYESQVNFLNVGLRSLHVIYTPDKDEQDNVRGWIASIVDISERRKADQALREANARLSGLINSAMDAVIAVDDRQRIVLFNPAAERIFDCSASEAIGDSLDRFIPARFRGVHGQHIQNFGHTGVTNRSMSRPGTLWGLRQNGEEFPIEATISQIEIGGQKLFTVILRDITERNRAETRLAEQASLLELASDAIIVRDEEGRIAYWNKGAQALYGWTPEEAVGKITHSLLETKFPQPLAAIEAHVRREKHWQGELVHTCKDGTAVTVFSRWAQTYHEKDASGSRSVLEINTDVTRRRQLETALRSNERLALAGRLSASIAHEIHNPLDTVANALFLLDQRLDGQPDVKQLISMAQSETQRVVEISKNMLSLHRESRAVSLVRLSELLEGVVTLIEETIAKGRRKIEIAPGFTGEVEAFPSELRQVFTNVIKNAVEATAENGEIRIYSEAAQEADQDGVMVRVVDNGVGIPEELQSKLFNPFVTTKEESGTGLGLWVSRSILEKHGGSIKLSNSAGPESRGTTVSIFLPLRVISKKTSGTQNNSLA